LFYFLTIDQKDAVVIANLCISGLLQISIARNWINSTLKIVQLSQRIVQATFPGKSPLMQLPFMEPRVLEILNKNTPKINNVIDLKKLGYEKLCSLLPFLDENQLKTIEYVVEKIPTVRVAKAVYSVFGDPIITTNSLVTLSVKFQCVFNEKTILCDDNIEEYNDQKKKKWWREDNEKTVAHCPYYPGTKKSIFTVMLANARIGRLISFQKVYGLDQTHTVHLQFQAPPEPGSWTFQVYISSDTFIGIDHVFDAKLKVENPEILPHEEVDDEISEPEDFYVEEETEKPKPKKKVILFNNRLKRVNLMILMIPKMKRRGIMMMRIQILLNKPYLSFDRYFKDALSCLMPNHK
jgi:translocation protein SEC63